MTINRHNYEEFFILYLDNELSIGERRQVDLFVQQHPDLGEELQMLQQTRLDVDSSIVFEGKESLMQLPSLELINSKNYEEWLVQYVDNELNHEQNASVEIYAASNSTAGAALDVLLKTKLQPDNSITFFNKESLYRREEAPVRRIVPVLWWRIAAAVLLLITLTIGGLTFFRNKGTTPDKGLVNIKDVPKNTTPALVDEKKSAIKDELVVTQPNSDQSTEEQSSSQKEEQINRQKDNDQILVKKIDRSVNPVRKSIEDNTPVIAKQNDNNPNNLPDARRNPNMNGAPKNYAVLAALDETALTKLKENPSRPPVTSGRSGSFIQTKNTLTNDNDVAVNEPENKTKFRGLLRKITRTFEKTTNIKATDEDDRLLVAGLAIRL